MLGDIDPYVISKHYDISSENGLRVTDMHTDYYLKEGEGSVYRSKRFSTFCAMVGLKDWDGEKFVNLSPEMLVKNLNECFSEFDRIVQHYGIEKIKTIGDAYMAAGGIPIPTSLHALDTVRAAIDIREYMHKWNLEREEKNLIRLNVRIGIHSWNSLGSCGSRSGWNP